MNNKKHSFTTLTLLTFVITLITLGGLSDRHNCLAQTPDSQTAPAVNPAGQSEQAPAPASQTCEILALLAGGQFDQAAAAIEKLTPEQKQSPLAKQILELNDQYLALHSQMTQAYHQAYDEHIKKMSTAIDNTKWRGHVLNASQDYKLESEDKTKFEKDQNDEIEKQWINALAQLTICKNLIENMKLDETIDPALKEPIITHALQYADELEQKQNWLESYQRVYSYLASLEPTNQQYEQHSRELIRKASLVNMYVPDPNQTSVSWEERRKGVTFDIITTAMGILNQNYVEQPDYNAMCQKALEFCVLISKTPALSKTFPALDDPEKVQKYQQGIKELADQIQSLPSQQYGYYYLLNFLRKTLRVNEESLKLPAEVIMAEFTEGAFAALDSYTYVIWPGDVNEFRKDMTGEFSGIGILISKTDGLLKVSSLLDDSPAGLSGIDAGDTIVAINGQSTANITLEMAVKKITGPENTKVVLTINRDGFDKPREFTITRKKIVVNDVRGLYRDPAGQWEYYIDPNDGIAYVRLTNFYAETAQRLKDLYEQFKQKKLNGLVLDLRNNSGGFLTTAVQIVNEFVDDGVIVSTRRRDAMEGSADKADPKAVLSTELPLVVLVNELSASASEIVAGAVQDYHRALIVGSHSFGKGNVQTIQPLRPSDAELKITIAYYYLPSGRRVHRDPNNKISKDYGVIPDVTVDLTGSQARDMYELQQKAAVLHQNGHSDDPAAPAHKWDTYTSEQIIKSDPQLQMAILSLKALMLQKNLNTL